jgi:hypothetical protein
VAQAVDSERAATHVERLWPGPWVWAIALAAVAALAIAYARAVGPALGWLIGAIGAVGVVIGVLRLATRIVVGPEGLRAGRALLPWQHVGQVLPLDSDQARRARGPQGDPSAFLLLRPGVGPGAVVVEVADPEDPHRTWLLATRDPQRLARAIVDARGSLAP